MKKHKKLLALLLSFVMLFNVSSIAFADEYNIIEDSSMSVVTDDAQYEDNSEILSEDIEINDTPVVFDEIITWIPTTTDDLSPQVEVLLEDYVVKCGLKSRSGDTFFWYINVDCPTSLVNKPHISIKARVQASYSDGSYYTNCGNLQTFELSTNADYAMDHLWTTTAKTGYYRMYLELHDYDNNDSGYHQTSYKILNRTGHEWTFTFYDTGKVLPEPRADWVKGYICERDTSLPGSYYTTYANRTGKTLDRSLYDVHHIQPLSLGGNNDYTNLIHLPKDLHTKVSGWFNGY